MSKITLGAYGIINYMIQRDRMAAITNQNLVKLTTNEIIEPKNKIVIDASSEFKTEDNNGIIGIITYGEYEFLGIGKSNNKCLIKTNCQKILIYSKGNYDVEVIAPNIKKIRIKSHNLSLKICYWEYSVSEIRDIITEYFKNSKITDITNLTDNLDENWNDILSISLNNSISNNNFSNPKIEIISRNVNKNISEISNKYNFKIIIDSFNKSNNEIIDDPNLISIISQDFNSVNFTTYELLIWVMNYVEIFTTSEGKFFIYLENQNFNEQNKKLFVNFIIAHKIASLYLNINSEKELELITLLNSIIDSSDNINKLIKDSITKYGLVQNNDSNYYYNNYINISEKNYNNYIHISEKNYNNYIQ